MATTIPALTSVDDILDTDLVMVTHSNGQTFKINGAELNKRNQAVISANTTLTGAPLKTRNIIRAYFTADLVAANSSTPLTLSYNGVSYTVKVPKNGALANYLPFDVGGGVYKYLQAYTTLELLFDGTNLVVQGNPVVLSSADYTIYPDGNGRTNVVAANNLQSVTSNAVANCLSMNGTENEAGEYFGNKRYHKTFIYDNIYLVPNTTAVLATNFEIRYGKAVGVNCFIISNNGAWSNDIKVYILSDGTLAVRSATMGNSNFAIVLDIYYVK